MMTQETRRTQLQELCAAVRKYATTRDYQHLPLTSKPLTQHPGHLIHSFNPLTSNLATQLSHFLTGFAFG